MENKATGQCPCGEQGYYTMSVWTATTKMSVWTARSLDDVHVENKATGKVRVVGKVTSQCPCGGQSHWTRTVWMARSLDSVQWRIKPLDKVRVDGKVTRQCSFAGQSHLTVAVWTARSLGSVPCGQQVTSVHVQGRVNRQCPCGVQCLYGGQGHQADSVPVEVTVTKLWPYGGQGHQTVSLWKSRPLDYGHMEGKVPRQCPCGSHGH